MLIPDFATRQCPLQYHHLRMTESFQVLPDYVVSHGISSPRSTLTLLQLLKKDASCPDKASSPRVNPHRSAATPSFAPSAAASSEAMMLVFQLPARRRLPPDPPAPRALWRLVRIFRRCGPSRHRPFPSRFQHAPVYQTNTPAGADPHRRIPKSPRR